MKFLWTVALLSSPALLLAETKIDFNRDIRPILSDKCFFCHGPDAKNQKSDFRLDSEANAIADLGGYAGITPGDLEKSELHWRIRVEEDDVDYMPPLDSNRTLSEAEKDLLDAWILQGAEYDTHWAFKKPIRLDPPKISAKNEKWVQNPIDEFIAAKLEEEGLSPSTRATHETLVRRASLALTGLQPTPEESTQAADYAKWCDQLLNSTDYAERQTLRWLDSARYADTDGYQNDGERSNWPWRDWVIQAFHENKPFDEFTIEQLAGDMLPEADNEQILASAFNRNHRQNSEGGALAEEFFIENVIDRVETTSTVWLGLTMGCSRCHDHKYDPISQREFYQFFAYFNNTGEKGIGKGPSANPVLATHSPLTKPSPSQQAELDAAVAETKKAQASLNQRLKTWSNGIAAAARKDSGHWTPAKTETAKVIKGGQLIAEPEGSYLFQGDNGLTNVEYRIALASNSSPITALRLDALTHPAFGKPRQLARSVNGNFVLTEIEFFATRSGKGKPEKILIKGASASYQQDGYPIDNTIDGNPKSGWAVSGKDVRAESVSAFFTLEEPIVLERKGTLEVRLKHQSKFADHNIGRFRIMTTDQENPDVRDTVGLSPKILSAIKVPENKRSQGQQKTLRDYYTTIDEPLLKARKKVAALNRKLDALGVGKAPVMVMREKEGEPTPAYLLDRGLYDQPDTSEALPRGVPEALFVGESEDMPQDRLELAQWIVAPDNPLTSRVIVNRVWRDYFGTGLVKTVEDFGSQGEPPSNPHLLDWLAVEFVESGWDLKALHQLILSSATFQQSSKVTPKLVAADPENRFLARGPRMRLDGFSIRDTALHAAGLLDERVGGPPVKPYQPEGLWNDVAGRSSIRYELDSGNDLFRKSLYTYWKRAVNPPRQIIFDSSGREMCNVTINRTNTPLQALVLMNDETFIEAARHIAARSLTEKPSNNEADRLGYLYELVTARKITTIQLETLTKNLTFFREHFASKPESAETFLKIGSTPRNESLDPIEHAAHTAVAHLVLNLDESITLE